MRWRPTSHAEAIHYERQLLDRFTRGSYVASDVKVRAAALTSCAPAAGPRSAPSHPPSPNTRTRLQPRAQIGPGPEDFIHTVVGGQAGGPAFVAIPGYSTGSSFLFKLFDGLGAAFHLHAVDLLGTGLSGAPCGWVP